MTLGEKIRKVRKERKITQAHLVCGQITRNMLSAIENDKATPSLQTITHIADKLSLPVSYFLSDDDDLFFYEKKKSIGDIIKLYKAKRYSECIEKIHSVNGVDDELAYLLATSYFELGRRSVLSGSLSSGAKQLEEAKNYFSKTVYNTEREENLTLLYYALAKNIQSPLLEFDRQKFEESLPDVKDHELMQYISQNSGYKYKTQIFAEHFEARAMMRARKYRDAINLMKKIENSKTPDSYISCLVFGLYTDLEICYKQLGDFESAYRYATKRLSLIEGFKK